MTFTAFEVVLGVVIYEFAAEAVRWAVRHARDRRHEKVRKVVADAAADAERRAAAGECLRCDGSGVGAAWNAACPICRGTGRNPTTKREWP